VSTKIPNSHNTAYYSRLTGVGSYLPETSLSNFDIEKFVDTTDAWIYERTGIRRRHIAGADDTASSMAVKAARAALEMAELDPEDLDLIIVGTCTPDRVFPSVACLVQENLGIKKSIPAFDLTAACAGFIYGLSIADKFVKSGEAKHALVIGSEVMSRILDWDDRRTCVLFGDGAGAVVLSRDSSPGILTTHIHAAGQHKDLLYLHNTIRQEGPLVTLPHIVMEGQEVFRIAVRELGNSVVEALAAANLRQDDIDWLVPHQANLRIIQSVAKRLQLEPEQVVLTLEEHGNTSAASIPLALDVAVRDGRIRRGHRILMEGFGGGMAWGSALVQL